MYYYPSELFVVLLTKIWPKNIDFYRYSYNVGERAVLPPPPPFTPKSDRFNLSCSF